MGKLPRYPNIHTSVPNASPSRLIFRDLPQPIPNRYRKTRRILLTSSQEFIVFGIGALCLGALAASLWISGGEGNSSTSAQSPDSSQPPETIPGHREIAEAVAPRKLPRVDEVIGKILQQGRDEAPDLHSITAIESLRLTRNAQTGESNFAGKVESLAPLSTAPAPEATAATTGGSSGKEVIGASISDSGENGSNEIGSGSQDGGGGIAAFPGSGGFNETGLLSSAAGPGTRRALPYIPIEGTIAAGTGEVLANASGGSASGTGATGSAVGSGNSPAETGDGSGLPERNGEKSKPSASNENVTASPGQGETPSDSGASGADFSSSGTDSGASSETVASGAGESLSSDPQQRPFREVPPLIGPPASAAGGILASGGTSGTAPTNDGGSVTTASTAPSSLPGNPVPLVIPPVATGGSAVGRAGPSAPAGTLPAPGQNPPQAGSNHHPSAHTGTFEAGTFEAGPGPSSAPGEATSGNSGNSVNSEGNRRNDTPSLAPVLPAAGTGAAATGSGVFPAPGPPAPPGGEEQSNAGNEEDHDLPEHCIPWVVQPGQTVESLAAATGTTPDVIHRINRTSAIRPGQMIRLPAAFLIPCCD